MPKTPDTPQPSKNNKQSSILSAANIVIIGPRASGKTTYLAGLTAIAALKKDQLFKIDKVGVRLEPKIGDAASKKLADDAQNKLFSKDPLKRTDLQTKADIVTYKFRGAIEYKGGKDEFDIQATDFPGEGLEKIDARGSFQRLYIEEQMAEKKVRLLILLADWERKESGLSSSKALEDSQLASKLAELRLIIQDTDGFDAANFRCAVAINKCERGELWTNRLEPYKHIFKRYLPLSTNQIEGIFEDFKIPTSNLRFFAMSTFGVLGFRDDFRPNRDDFVVPHTGDKEAVLRDSSPEKWHPYGMLSPLYWLTTTTNLRLPDHV
jgi:GTPase SAR1 family protein